jgi:hypothetical protein
VRLHNFSYLLSMNLSRSQDLNRKFNRLTRVDLVLFFFLIYFFSISSSILGWLKLNFVFFFFIIWGYSNIMTRVVSLTNWPCSYFFGLFIIGFFLIKLHICFWFAFYGVISIWWLRSQVRQIDRSWINLFFIFFNHIF